VLRQLALKAPQVLEQGPRDGLPALSCPNLGG
jgi:hypothetical protein